MTMHRASIAVLATPEKLPRSSKMSAALRHGRLTVPSKALLALLKSLSQSKLPLAVWTTLLNCTLVLSDPARGGDSRALFVSKALGQCHALIRSYVRHRRPAVRSNQLTWPTPQAIDCALLC